MTKQEFIRHVMEILNDADPDYNFEMLNGSDSANVSLYVEKLYPAAWRRAVKMFPITWFDQKSFVNAPHIVDAPDGTGHVILPKDYLDLSYFKMKGWKSACLTAPEENAAINLKQSNEFTRGTPQRPVCVLRMTTYKEDLSSPDQFRKALYYYSLPKSDDANTHEIEQALYVPNVTAIPEEITFDDNLSEPLAYLCASTVLTSFEKQEAAKAIDSKVSEMK